MPVGSKIIIAFAMSGDYGMKFKKGDRVGRKEEGGEWYDVRLLED